MIKMQLYDIKKSFQSYVISMYMKSYELVIWE